MKILLVSIIFFLKSVPWGVIGEKSSLALDNGLAPERRQTIIQTNDDQVQLRIHLWDLGEMS